MTRLENWPHLFDVFLFENSARRFKYGEWDCCLFVAGAIQAMTGVDAAAPYRDKYSSRVEALQLAESMHGKKSIQAITESVATSNGMSEISLLHARRGDMVLIKRAGGRDFSLGIVSLSGHRILIALGKSIGSLPIERGFRAWRVG